MNDPQLQSHHLRVQGDLLGQTDAVTDLKSMKKTDDQTERRMCYTTSQTDKRTHNLLSIVVGFKDVAHGSAVAPPACRLQNKTKQPLVVLMGQTLHHSGERELQRDTAGCQLAKTKVTQLKS